MSRADYNTPQNKVTVRYSDFLDDFSRSPITGDLARVTNNQSIQQSLYNLIMTMFGEVPFEPNIGCGVYQTLFEPNDTILAQDIKYHITQTVNNYEPRVNLISVAASPNNSSISITIKYTIINSDNTPQNLTLVLQRLR